MGRAGTIRTSICAGAIAAAASFAYATTIAIADVKWFYSGTVTIYHYNPTRLDAKPVSGFVDASDKNAAMIAAKKEAESKFRGQGNLVTANVVVKKWDKGNPPPADDDTRVETPNDPQRGTDQPVGATGGGGKPNRLVVPDGAKIRGVKVFAGRRVDGFHFLGSNSKWYAFKGYGTPDPKEIMFADDEFLVGFRGVYGDQWDRVWVITNKTEYGPYGGSGGKQEFKITVPDGHEVIGMHGRTGKVIDRAGLVTEAKK